MNLSRTERAWHSGDALTRLKKFTGEFVKEHLIEAFQHSQNDPFVKGGSVDRAEFLRAWKLNQQVEEILSKDPNATIKSIKERFSQKRGRESKQLETLNLRAYQMEALSDYLSHNRNIGIAFQTGMGKTALYMEIVRNFFEQEQNQDKKVIVTVPVKLLADQVQKSTIGKFRQLQKLRERIDSGQLIINTPHSIIGKIGKTIDPEEIGLVIVDEGGIGAKQATGNYPTFKIRSQVPNARYLIVDATPIEREFLKIKFDIDDKDWHFGEQAGYIRPKAYVPEIIDSTPTHDRICNTYSKRFLQRFLNELSEGLSSIEKLARTFHNLAASSYECLKRYKGVPSREAKYKMQYQIYSEEFRLFQDLLELFHQAKIIPTTGHPNELNDEIARFKDQAEPRLMSHDFNQICQKITEYIGRFKAKASSLPKASQKYQLYSLAITTLYELLNQTLVFFRAGSLYKILRNQSYGEFIMRVERYISDYLEANQKGFSRNKRQINGRSINRFTEQRFFQGKTEDKKHSKTSEAGPNLETRIENSAIVKFKDALKQMWQEGHRHPKVQILKKRLDQILIEDSARPVVFCKSKMEQDYLSWLCNNDWQVPAATCRGGKEGYITAQQKFGLWMHESGLAPVLFTTEVMSRGVDSKVITHVLVNGSFKNAEQRLQTIGRIRKGGVAIVMMQGKVNNSYTYSQFAKEKRNEQKILEFASWRKNQSKPTSNSTRFHKAPKPEDQFAQALHQIPAGPGKSVSERFRIKEIIDTSVSSDDTFRVILEDKTGTIEFRIKLQNPKEVQDFKNKYKPGDLVIANGHVRKTTKGYSIIFGSPLEGLFNFGLIPCPEIEFDEESILGPAVQQNILSYEAPRCKPCEPAQKPVRQLPKRSENAGDQLSIFEDLVSHQESNLDLLLRRELFYPLNYEDESN